MKLDYSIADFADKPALRKLIEEKGAGGWELRHISYIEKQAVFSRRAEEPVKEVHMGKIEGYRTVIALALFALFEAGKLAGVITPDVIGPEKQDAVRGILASLAGIYGALKLNRFLGKK